MPSYVFGGTTVALSGFQWLRPQAPWDPTVPTKTLQTTYDGGATVTALTPPHLISMPVPSKQIITKVNLSVVVPKEQTPKPGGWVIKARIFAGSATPTGQISGVVGPGYLCRLMGEVAVDTQTDTPGFPALGMFNRAMVPGAPVGPISPILPGESLMVLIFALPPAQVVNLAATIDTVPIP